MNPPTTIVQHKTCYKCHFETETAERLCPRCRKKLWTRTETRGMGAVLAVLGTFLVVMMSAIIIFMLGLVNQSAKPGTGARFTGTKDEMYMAFGILGFVLLFGFTSLVAGLWQLIFGRRNMILIYVILGLGAIFLIGGTIFRAVAGD
jgi:MFS family permease